MPSQRKRIGFLPKSEVQQIIDKICKHNKLSQSKVTGILVEEALSSRGVLNSSIDSLSFDFISNKDNSLFINHAICDSDLPKKNNDTNLNESYINEEVKMINDFIEYKFFKKIMNKNKKKL